jgi:hypothetical protein
MLNSSCLFLPSSRPLTPLTPSRPLPLVLVLAGHLQRFSWCLGIQDGAGICNLALSHVVLS